MKLVIVICTHTEKVLPIESRQSLASRSGAQLIGCGGAAYTPMLTLGDDELGFPMERARSDRF